MSSSFSSKNLKCVEKKLITYSKKKFNHYQKDEKMNSKLPSSNKKHAMLGQRRLNFKNS
jgi:hypothetical protein